MMFLQTPLLAILLAPLLVLSSIQYADLDLRTPNEDGYDSLANNETAIQLFGRDLPIGTCNKDTPCPNGACCGDDNLCGYTDKQCGKGCRSHCKSIWTFPRFLHFYHIKVLCFLFFFLTILIIGSLPKCKRRELVRVVHAPNFKLAMMFLAAKKMLTTYKSIKKKILRQDVLKPNLESSFAFEKSANEIEQAMQRLSVVHTRLKAKRNALSMFVAPNLDFVDRLPSFANGQIKQIRNTALAVHLTVAAARSIVPRAEEETVFRNAV